MPQRKAALRRLSYGVYVLSARREDESGVFTQSAMTVRQVSQVSTRPLCVSVSVAKRRHTHDFLGVGGAFALSILGRGQELLGGHFGLSSGRDRDKFAGLDWTSGQSGAPILKECCAFLECRIIGAHEVGNSTLFIGEVIHAETFDNTPLLYRESDYFG